MRKAKRELEAAAFTSGIENHPLSGPRDLFIHNFTVSQFHISSKNEVGRRMTEEIGRVMGPEFIQGFILRHPLWFILHFLRIHL